MLFLHHFKKFCGVLSLSCIVPACASMAGSITANGGQTLDTLRADSAVQISLSLNPDFCLGVQGSDGAPTSPVVLMPCNGQVSQTWSYQAGRWHLFGTQCLTAIPATAGASGTLQIQPCDTGIAEQLVSRDKDSLTSGSNLCVDIAKNAPSSATPTVLTPCDAAVPTQRWVIAPVSSVAAPASGSGSTSTTPAAPASPGTTPTSPSAPTTPTAPTSPSAPTAPTTPTAPAGGVTNAPTVTGCAALGSWDSQAIAFEIEVLNLVNAQRAQGASCLGGATIGPQGPLAFDPRLTCETEAYGEAMVVGKFFSHTGQDGKSPFDRMTAAGVHWTAAAENIAEGQTSPQEVMAAWMSDAGHCQDLMGPYAITGIGFYQGAWVEDFAKE